VNQPSSILENGTWILTQSRLSDVEVGTFLRAEYLLTRTPNVRGQICGVVGGTGGDIYWVQHEDGLKSAYGWWEFDLALDLAPATAKTDALQDVSSIWERVKSDDL